MGRKKKEEKGKQRMNEGNYINEGRTKGREERRKKDRKEGDGRKRRKINGEGTKNE